jgi:hypothetical protein
MESRISNRWSSASDYEAKGVTDALLLIITGADVSRAIGIE